MNFPKTDLICVHFFVLGYLVRAELFVFQSALLVGMATSVRTSALALYASSVTLQAHTVKVLTLLHVLSIENCE